MRRTTWIAIASAVTLVALGLVGQRAFGLARATADGASPGVINVVRGIGAGVNTSQSSTWSGYNIGADRQQVPAGTTFSSVSGQWTVPKATPHTRGQAEDSASWVGIGGGCRYPFRCVPVTRSRSRSPRPARPDSGRSRSRT